MRKNVLMVGLSVLSLSSYGMLQSNNVAEINNNFIKEKGREYIRQGIMSDFQNRAGATKSNQYIEGVLGNGKYNGTGDYSKYKTDTKGIVIGTTSEFNKEEESSWITGVNFGYLTSDVNYDSIERKDKAENISTNAYLGYRDKNLLSFGYAGIGINKKKTNNFSEDKKNLNLGLEVGKIYSFSDRKYLYPYIGLDYSLFFLDDKDVGNLKYEKDIYNYGVGGVGISYFADYTKWQFKINARLNSEIFSSESGKVNFLNKSYDSFELEGRNLTVSFRVGYYLAEDILLTLETLGVYNEDYRDVVYGLRISHNF
ncbi:MAG: autotransporter domain-containing protein [Fusobacteriaceae bacterium]